jgi:lysophospholipase L1-like esterase
MAYKKQNFKEGQTLTHTHLNNIEDGIAAIEDALVGGALESLAIQPGRGITINGSTSGGSSGGNEGEDQFGGLLHYLLNTNADTKGALVDYHGRVTIGEWIPTNGKTLNVVYSNPHFAGTAIRYVNEDKTEAVEAAQSAYARIVFYNGTSTETVTADKVDETTVTINDRSYALMAGIFEDYVNDAYLENLETAAIEDNDVAIAENTPSSGVTIAVNDLLVSTTEDYVMQIFENIVCIGDSLTAGFTNKNGSTFGSNTTRPTKRNWPGYLGQRLNKDITNLGYGSTTTRSWRYGADGLGANIDLATKLTNTDCYIVSLGYNDRGKFSVGTVADIMADKTTNADTFYGNYDFIINSLLNVNNTCHIFLMTAPHPVDPNHAINVAIREIANLYPNRVHLIDLAANYNKFFKEGIIADTWNGHMFPLTYQLTSMTIQKAISSYMVTNYSKFYGTPWNGK